jgi:cytochrome c oxidase cbb3-type subunit 3
MSPNTKTEESSADGEVRDQVIHEYNGIEEYGNPVPGWLSLIFTGTIIWSVLYVIGINMGFIDRYQEDLAQGQEQLMELRAKASAGQPSVDGAFLAKVAENESRIKKGQKTYDSKCVSCHGEKLGGSVGPCLVDSKWIHGGSKTDIYKTIKNGVAQKGMPPWGPQLTQDEMANVVAYIDSRRGEVPEGAKKPEGKPYKPGDSKK